MQPRGVAWAVLIALLMASAVTFALPLRVTADEVSLAIDTRDNFFIPNVLRANPGDVATILVSNDGQIGHTFDLEAYAVHLGTPAAPIQPGQNRTVTITLQAGVFWFFCAVPGHASQQGTGYQGMAGQLIVGQQPTPIDPTVFIIAGVIGAAAVAVGLVAWARQRARHRQDKV